MSDYTLIPTSAEVVAVIRARHQDLRVFGTFSDPEGRANGGAGEIGRMETSYGFPDSDYPIIKIRTTWQIEGDSAARHLEQHDYWLCVAKECA